MVTETIYTNNVSCFSPGDTILTLTTDHRWWRRFLNWITFKGYPTIKTKYTIHTVSSNKIRIKL